MQVLAGLFLIAFLVVIHEAGHFLVARLFGVGTPIFSVGFGPRIAGVRWRGTDFRLSAIPFGGYVLLAGADPFGEEDVESEIPESERFLARPVWQRLLIMAAGPAVNLALPFVLFTALLMAGRPDWGTTVGQVLPGSEAERSGLRTGDVIVAVDGDPAEVWTDVEAATRARVGTSGPVRLDVRRADASVPVVLPAEALRPDRGGGVDLVAAGIQPWAHSTRVGVDDPASPAGRVGLRTGDRIVRVDGVEVLRWDELVAALSGPSHRVAWERAPVDGTGALETGEAVLVADAGWAGTPTLYPNPWGLAPVAVFASRVDESGPAARGGVRAGDRFVSLDGVPIASFEGFIAQVAATVPSGGVPRPVELAVVRDGALQALTLTPELQVVQGEAYARPVIGVRSHGGMGVAPPRAQKHFTFAEAVPQAARESLDVIRATLAAIGNLLTGWSSPRDSLGGPVEMFVSAGTAAEAGVFVYATLVAAISVSLGLINLLPIPVFDGGQIVFYLLELLRGRPLPLEVRERVQIVSVVGLVVLFLFVTVNDVGRNAAKVAAWFGL